MMEIKEEKERFVLLNDANEEAGEMILSNAGSKIMIIGSYICRSNIMWSGISRKTSWLQV